MTQRYTPRMAGSPTQLLTAEDLFELPDHGGRNELVRGALREMSPGSPQSSEISVLIAAALLGFVRPRSLGAVFGENAGFIISRNPDTVRAPDASFVRAERLPSKDEQQFFLPLAPDLVVEVVSPSDRMRDVNDKIHEYLDAGVRLVWLVEPRAKRITVYLPDRTARTLDACATLDGGAVLPGFSLPLTDLFA
jgi:Uma2 family endonuclease